MNSENKAALTSFDASKTIEPLIPLLESNYGASEISSHAYLRWEYQQNPAGPPVIAVAESESREIVGQYVVIPIEYAVDGRPVTGSLSLNTLTREDYRGKGLFTSLARRVYDDCKARGIGFTIGFPNPSSYPGFTRKLDFAHLGNMPVLFSPLRILGTARRALCMRWAKKYGGDLDISAGFERAQALRGGYTVARFDPVADEAGYGTFLHAFNRQYPQLTHRSPRYLRWRYRDIPTRKYVLVKVTRDDRFLGYCALRARQVYGLRTTMIVDLCCLHDDDGIRGGRALLRAVTRTLRSSGIDIAGAMMGRHTREYRVLRSSLFFAVPRKFLPHLAPFIVRTHGVEQPAGLKDMSRWFLTFGDYDVM